jgi:hypothetical protein
MKWKRLRVVQEREQVRTSKNLSTANATLFKNTLHRHKSSNTERHKTCFEIAAETQAPAAAHRRAR